MIPVYVRLKVSTGMPREQWLGPARRIATHFCSVPGQLRGALLVGKDGYAGRLQTWTDRKSAEAFYARPWRAGMIQMFGVQPVFTRPESTGIVDRAIGEVIVNRSQFERAGTV